MNTLLMLAMMPFLSSPFTSSDIVMQDDEVYNRVHEYEHKIAWSGSVGRKLKQLKVVKIIDYENNRAWLIDEENGRIGREDIYLQEQEEKRLQEKRLEELARADDERIASRLPEGGIHVTADGRIIRGLAKPTIDNRSYTVQFRVADDNISSGFIEEISKIFNKEDTLSLVGFASPDGDNPKMRIELAFRRITAVSTLLEANGFKVSKKLGVVCGSDIERSTCWRVDITTHRGIK